MVITIKFFSFIFFLKQTHTQKPYVLCKISKSDTVFLNRFFNNRDNDFLKICSLITIVNNDTIEDCMNGVTIIVLEKHNIVLPINHSPIPMCNNIKSNELKVFVTHYSRIQVGSILFLDTKYSGKFCGHQMSYLTRINCFYSSA